MKSSAVFRTAAYAVCLLALTLASRSTAKAANDALSLVVNGNTATGGPAIGGFAYNPVDNTMFVSGFQAEGRLQKISNLDTTPTSEEYMTYTELQFYYRDGDTTRGVSNGGLQSGILLNPKTIGSGPNAIAPYSMAIIADNSFTRLPNGSTATDPTVTKRFYQYNLQPVPNGGDGRNIFTTITTLSDMQAAIGAASTVTSNQGRQFAWSGDGQSIYFADSGSITGGIWKLNPVNGDVSRLYAADLSVEPAVRTSGGVDTIYFRSTGTSAGGISSITYDGSNVGAVAEVVSVAALREFLDAGADQTPVIASMATDAEGNIYFNNTDSTPERRGIFKLDVEGRLAKVVGQAERNAFVTEVRGTATNANSNTNRMQPRTIAHPTAGNITQMMYAENAFDGITGVNVFKTGDFDRNGAAGQAADMALFTAALKTRGTPVANIDEQKFDLNANSVVDWKDVKILQQFVDIPNGDANFDGVLNLVDLDIVGANYYTASPTANKTWAAGDFASVDPLYAANAVDANIVNLVDLELFADTWLNVLEQPITEGELTSRGYAGQFLTDVLDVFGFNTGLAGDFDLNGLVDGGDFLLWQRQFGTTVEAGTGADADGNGTIDAADLAVWNENFGAGSTPEVVAAAVPEPSTLLLGTLAVAGVARLRRRQSVR